MKIKDEVRSVLQEAWINDDLVEVKRKGLNASSVGFVIDISEKWLLLNIVDGNFLRGNGYEALRLQDITQAEIKTDWVSRAREKFGLEPVLQPDVLLIDLPGLLSSVNAHYPVLGIEREKTAPGILYIGRIEKLKKKFVTLREIDSNARWNSRDIQHLLKEITCVTFGDTYTKLLWEFARIQEAEATNGSDNRDIL